MDEAVLLLLDDNGRREAEMRRLLRKRGINLSVECFKTAPAFIAYHRAHGPQVVAMSLEPISKTLI